MGLSVREKELKKFRSLKFRPTHVRLPKRIKMARLERTCGECNIMRGAAVIDAGFVDEPPMP
ncbi:MAG: hypothetical protein Fues2KO_39090 [Fuerstiella sp.]